MNSRLPQNMVVAGKQDLGQVPEQIQLLAGDRTRAKSKGILTTKRHW